MSNQQAGAGYVIELYNDLEAFNNYVAQYKNIILEFQSKYSDKVKETNQSLLSPEENQRLINILTPIRHFSMTMTLKMNGLKKRITQFNGIDSPETLSLFEKVASQTNPEFKDVFEFAKKYNEYFVDGVIDELLIQAATLYQPAGNRNA